MMPATLRRSIRACRKDLIFAFVGRRFASSGPVVIKPGRDEISQGRLAARNLEKGIRALHDDGLVVIEDAVAHKDLDHLNAKMVRDARKLQERGKDMPFNYNVGNSKPLLCSNR